MYCPTKFAIHLRFTQALTEKTFPQGNAETGGAAATLLSWSFIWDGATSEVTPGGSHTRQIDRRPFRTRPLLRGRSLL